MIGLLLALQVGVVDSLPRTASGKILRRVVRDGFGEEMP